MNAAIGAVLASSLERNEAWALVAMLVIAGPDGLVTATQPEISQAARLALRILGPAIQSLVDMGLVGVIPAGRRLKYALNAKAIEALTCAPHAEVEPTYAPHAEVTRAPHAEVEPTYAPHAEVITRDESIEPAPQPRAPEVKTELEQSEAMRRANRPGDGFGEALNEVLNFYPLNPEAQDSTGPLKGLRECEDRWLEIAGKGRRILTSDETFIISELIIQHGGPGPVLEGMTRLVQNFERWTMTTLRLAMTPKPASQSKPPRPAAPPGKPNSYLGSKPSTPQPEPEPVAVPPGRVLCPACEGLAGRPTCDTCRTAGHVTAARAEEYLDGLEQSLVGIWRGSDHIPAKDVADLRRAREALRRVA